MDPDPADPVPPSAIDRRRFLTLASALGAAAVPGVLFAEEAKGSAVSYLQANRVRTLAQREMAKLMAGFDAYVVPSFGGTNLLLTNLTGHPTVVLPNGFKKDGTPGSLSFVGKLFGEGEAMAVAKAYQDATGFHRKHPVL